MIEDLGIVFAAEVVRRVRSRAFLIGALLGVVGIFALIRLPALIDRAFGSSNAVVLIGEPTIAAAAKPLLLDSFTIKAVLPPQPVDAALMKRYGITTAIVIASEKSGLKVNAYTKDPGAFAKSALARDLLPLHLQLATHRTASQVAALASVAVTVDPLGSKFASTAEADAARGVASTLIFFLYLLIMVNSQLVTSSVAEEKTSRIAELLVASVDPSALLGGKVLAGAALSIIQLAIWIGTSVYLSGGSAPAAGHSSETGFSLNNLFSVLTPTMLVAFLIYFVLGFFQLSTLLAAFASLINRTEDLGSISLPLVLPVVAAFIIAIATLGSPDTSFAVFTSMLPLLAPFVMFARIAVSNVPLWQIGLSLTINIVALYFIAIFAGKLYRVGMLLYGRPPRISQIWNVLRT